AQSEEDSMFGLGVQELLIIFGIAIVIFGPSKLPQIGAGLGKAIRDFKKGVSNNDENEEGDKDDKKPANKDLPN
ncbi:MAG: twin-arginine translocase TatA/TatE family subunit, partial [Candidatus Binatia bacterium]